MVEEGLIKKLMTKIKCDVCGRGYEVANIDVVGHEEDLWFLKALCPYCHTQCLLAAVVKEGKEAQVISELTEAELKRFGEEDGISCDDRLDMHNFLKDFNGDFSRLFSRKQD